MGKVGPKKIVKNVADARLVDAWWVGRDLMSVLWNLKLKPPKPSVNKKARSACVSGYWLLG